MGVQQSLDNHTSISKRIPRLEKKKEELEDHSQTLKSYSTWKNPSHVAFKGKITRDPQKLPNRPWAQLEACQTLVAHNRPWGLLPCTLWVHSKWLTHKKESNLETPTKQPILDPQKPPPSAYTTFRIYAKSCTAQVANTRDTTLSNQVGSTASTPGKLRWP